MLQQEGAETALTHPPTTGLRGSEGHKVKTTATAGRHPEQTLQASSWPAG